ncbi:monooxygenase [Stygiomarasmius scandens]|uniref:Monooxygenase n=1 Tax=Marasmiellus scandens TaxID=2682957 RepID=A0ABR1ITT7_9AGAR
MVIPGSGIKKICIIGGGGPAGLAALKTILDTLEYKNGLWEPTAYEARGGLGGVWLPSPPTPSDPASSSLHAHPETPLYDSLTTNLPHPVMAFPSFSFPPSTPLFPKAHVVQKYLEDYADWWNVRRLIQLGTRVVGVERNSNLSLGEGQDGGREWTVRILRQGQKESHQFDYLFICSGHYQVPRFPSCTGIDKWLERDKAVHSVWYRNPKSLKEFLHKARAANAPSPLRIVVIGSGPSGSDISAELASTDSVDLEMVFWSFSGGELELETETEVETVGVDTNANEVRSTPKYKPKLAKRGRIVSFGDPNAGEVSFTAQGTRGAVLKETGIDLVILATGYEVRFPFFQPSGVIREGIPPPPLFSTTSSATSTTTQEIGLWNSTYHVFPLARHVFPLSLSSASPASEAPVSSLTTTMPMTPPTIAFLGLPVRVAPFPILEAQARAAVGVFALSLSPSSPGDGKEKGKIHLSWDPEKEWAAVRLRYDALRDKIVGSAATTSMVHKLKGEDVETGIASAWHKFDGHEQFNYRDELWTWAEGNEAETSISFSVNGVTAVAGNTPTISGIPTALGRTSKVRVEPWEIGAYDDKTILRKFWVHLEHSGEAEGWVRGVGSVGGTVTHGQGLEAKREWVGFLERIRKEAGRWERGEI